MREKSKFHFSKKLWHILDHACLLQVSKCRDQNVSCIFLSFTLVKMSDTSTSDDEDVLNVYTDVSDDDVDTYSRGSNSEVEVS